MQLQMVQLTLEDFYAASSCVELRRQKVTKRRRRKKAKDKVLLGSDIFCAATLFDRRHQCDANKRGELQCKAASATDAEALRA